MRVTTLIRNFIVGFVFLNTYAANAQVINWNSFQTNTCIGSTAVINFSFSGFPAGSVFELQASKANFLFGFPITVLETSTTGSLSAYFPIGNLAGPVQLRIANRTLTGIYSTVLTTNVTNCGGRVVTTQAISTQSTYNVCLGVSFSVPFSTLNIAANDGTFELQYRENASQSFNAITASVNNNRNNFTVSLPWSVGSKIGLQFRVVHKVGTTITAGSISPTLVNSASCFEIHTVSNVVKSMPEAIRKDSMLTGISTGFAGQFKAILSDRNGVFAATPLLSFQSSSFPISVNYPCHLQDGTGYRWKVIISRQNTGTFLAEAISNPFSIGSAPTSISVTTKDLTVRTRTMSFESKIFQSHLYPDSICMDQPVSQILVDLKGCFPTGNQFMVDLAPHNPTLQTESFVLSSLRTPLVIPSHINQGRYGLTVRATGSSVKSTETGLFRLVRCHKITLKWACMEGGVTKIGYLQEGNFGAGNSFQGTASYTYGFLKGTSLSNSSTEPILNFQNSMQLASNISIKVKSTKPVKESNTMTLSSLQACPVSSIQLQSASSATLCKGGLLTVHFSKTGLLDSQSVYQLVITPSTGGVTRINPVRKLGVSPLTYEIPNIATAASYSVRLESKYPVISSNSLNGFTLGNCPTISNSLVPSQVLIGNQGIPEICAGSAINLNLSTTGSFSGGNQFRMELSALGGEFHLSKVIGTTNTGNQVQGQIPFSTIPGLYRVRIVSFAPWIKPAAYVQIIVREAPVIYAAGWSGTGHVVLGQGFAGGLTLKYGNSNGVYSLVSDKELNSVFPAGAPATGQMTITKGGCVSNQILYSNIAVARQAIDFENLSVSAEIKLYPNPGDGEPNLEWLAEADGLVRVISLSGKIVLEKSFSEGQNQLSLNLRQERENMFIVQIMEPTGLKTLKYLKNK